METKKNTKGLKRKKKKMNIVGKDYGSMCL